MQHVNGKSKELIQNTNSISLQNNPLFVAASNVYDNIIKTAVDFVSKHAPVTQLELSRYNYNSIPSNINPNSSTTYYLTAVYISRITHVITARKTISSFIISPELHYILITEGWERIGSFPEPTYILHVSRNGINFY